MFDSLAYFGDMGLTTKEGAGIPLVGVFADAAIIGKSAKVKITQKYKNNSKNAVEAVYRFPLPENATVTGFCVLLKDKIIKSEIEEKETAFKVYDDALIKGNGAVLLDQERPNIFTLSVGNLNPGSEASIEIEYISVLEFKNNNLRFFLPTTISPRYVPAGMPDEDGVPTGKKVHPEYADAVSYGLSLKVNIFKAIGMEIDFISSPSHKIKTGFNENSFMTEFASETVSMDRDFVLDIGYGKAALNTAVYFNDGQESFMQIDFTPDLEKKTQNSSGVNDSNNINDKNAAADAGSEIIFVLDCSGSMEGSSITQAKKSLEILIKALSPGQMFNIYRFGNSFDKFSLRGEKFDEISLNAAMDFLDKTDATFGGTEILGPLKDIFSSALGKPAIGPADTRGSINSIKNIVLITDGEVGNEMEVVKLVHSNWEYFRVFTVGIGFGPNEYFIKEMAQSTSADYIIVHPEERIDLKVISMFKKLNMGAVENIKIDFGFKHGEIEVVPMLRSIFSGNSSQIFARISSSEAKRAEDKDAESSWRSPVYLRDRALENKTGILSHGAPGAVPENILITGVFKGKEVGWSLPVMVVSGEEGLAGFIPKLWAREKIRELEVGFAQVKGSMQAERKKEQTDELIIDISKKYGVISSKTSFVSVEERSDEEKTKGEVTLKKIQTLVTYGWHGFGAQVAAPGQPFMINSAMPSMPGLKQGVRKGYVAKSIGSEHLFMDRNIDRSSENDISEERLYCARNFTLGKRETADYDIKDPKAKKIQNNISAGYKNKLKEEVLMEILSNQKPAGGFEFGGRLSALLKIDINDLKAAAGAMEIKGLDKKTAGAGGINSSNKAIKNRNTDDMHTGGEKINGTVKQGLNMKVDLTADERFTLIVTALLIGILIKFFKDTSDSWEMIVGKSRKWLEEKNIDLNPIISSKPLNDFISDYILKLKLFRNPK